jgi:hypothetical protein
MAPTFCGSRSQNDTNEGKQVVIDTPLGEKGRRMRVARKNSSNHRLNAGAATMSFNMDSFEAVIAAILQRQGQSDSRVPMSGEPIRER